MAGEPLADRIVLQAGAEPSESRRSPPPILVYFIPGNPGLIEYYRHFLVLLSRNVESSRPLIFAGNSSAGFGVSADHVTKNASSRVPLDLQQQCRFVHSQLEATIFREMADNPQPASVILMGHSVGAYMMMETILRVQTQRQHLPYRILGAIALFPTIVDIARSPTGRILAPLAHIPFLPHLLSHLVRLCHMLLPWTTFVSLVRYATRQPRSAAHITASFLASRTGVLQAVHMAQHELREITSDRWTDDVWKSAKPGAPRLVFHWGCADYWVAERTRDGVIAAHAGERVRMEIDGDGVPHDFCIRHSESVARRVRGYIEDIIREGT